MNRSLIFFIFIFFFAFCCESYSETNTTELKTYLPSPSANYNKLTLVPHALTGSCTPGSMAMNERNELIVCDSGQWETSSGFWARRGDERILFTQNLSDSVGIGTSNPQAKLHVFRSCGAASVLISGVGDQNNYGCIGFTDEKGINGLETNGWSMCHTVGKRPDNTIDENYANQLVISRWDKRLYGATDSHRNIFFLTKDGKLGINTDRVPVVNLEVLDDRNSAGLVVGGKGGEFTHSCLALTDENGAWNPRQGKSINGWNMCLTNSTDNNYDEQFVLQKWAGTEHSNVLFISKDGKMGLNTGRVPLATMEILKNDAPASLLVGGKAGRYVNSCIALSDEKGVWDPAKGVSLNGWNMCYTNAPSQYPNWDQILVFQKWTNVDHINAMLITPNGNVAIGGDLPEAKLHVKGNLKVDNDVTIGNKSSSRLPFITFMSSFNVNGLAKIMVNRESTLQFFINGGTAMIERMSITKSGSIGIGITAPQAKLDVNGDMKLAEGNTACNSAREGTMRYVKSRKSVQVCDGTAWKTLTMQ